MESLTKIRIKNINMNNDLFVKAAIFLLTDSELYITGRVFCTRTACLGHL